jgi:hypothetical protein
MLRGLSARLAGADLSLREDFFQEGVAALLRAQERFDATKGFAEHFATRSALAASATAVARSGVGPGLRHALQTRLFTLRLIEIDAKPELPRQMAATRAQWSNKAERALKELHDDEKASDETAFLREPASRKDAGVDEKPIPFRVEAETAL